MLWECDRPRWPPDVASVSRELLLAPAHWSNPVLAPEERFWRAQKRLYWSRGGGKVQNKSCWKWFKLICFILMNLFCLVFERRKWVPKPLLGCQNLVTSTGGCQNLFPGWHLQRRGPAWSVMCPSFLSESEPETDPDSDLNLEPLFSEPDTFRQIEEIFPNTDN